MSDNDQRREDEKQQPNLERRTLLKAAWVAPLVLSVAASQAFAASGGTPTDPNGNPTGAQD